MLVFKCICLWTIYLIYLFFNSKKNKNNVYKKYRSDSYSKAFVWIISYSTLDFEVKANYSLQCEYSEQLAIILVTERFFAHYMLSLLAIFVWEVTETDRWS